MYSYIDLCVFVSVCVCSALYGNEDGYFCGSTHIRHEWLFLCISLCVFRVLPAGRKVTKGEATVFFGYKDHWEQADEESLYILPKFQVCKGLRKGRVIGHFQVIPLPNNDIVIG